MTGRLHDVVIVGAGPAGSTTAHSLAQAGLDVLLIDKAVFPRDKTCGDGLTPRALAVLAELGVLDDLIAQGCLMTEATVIAPKGTTITTHMPERDDMPNYMLAVPRLVLDETIRQRALNSGAKYIDGLHVQRLVTDIDGVTIQGKRNGAPVTARGRMVVIAVGSNMRLLKTLGILKKIPPVILAARGYYESVKELSGRFEFYFEGIPLPGYGWVFPLSENTANIGAGVWGPKGYTAQSVMKGFLQIPAMRRMLSNADQVGPIRGFPIRSDFATAPTYAERLLLVGEAAGLVNPLTGEGVDYALESGQMAAHHLQKMFAAGDFSTVYLEKYDAALREHFQKLFVFSTRIRNWYLRAPILNRLVDVANKRDELRALFTDIVLGNADAARALSLETVAKVVFTR